MTDQMAGAAVDRGARQPVPRLSGVESGGNDSLLGRALRRAAGANLVTHNLRIDGRRTTMRLEPTMWDGLQEIAAREGRDIDAIATDVARLKRPDTSHTAAMRVFITAYFRHATRG